MRPIAALALLCLALTGCERAPEPAPSVAASDPRALHATAQLTRLAPVRLTFDLATLSERERKMLVPMVRAAEVMDGLFWRNAYPGDRDALLASIADPDLRRYVALNYGPWDRFAEDAPLLEGVGPKPTGASFYPSDMTKDEFEAWPADDAAKRGLYSLVRRGADGKLALRPFHEEYRAELERAAGLLRQAAALADDAGLKRYLELRAAALTSDDYRASDVAWMEMKTNRLDLVIGPIETYEDALFNYRAAYEAYVLVKDLAWSERLARFASLLPDLQRGLPVPERYKREVPGANSDLNAYDVLYFAGHSNAGAKTIAINLPNDESVQLEKGSRRLQLKNVMRAKFDRILAPIADQLVDPAQRANVKFDAFFSNVMFHEVAHGLGIKRTIDGKGTVSKALREHAGALEEGKADILGLYMVTELHRRGELAETTMLDHYVTFMAGIVRSVRFGANDAHGRANMVQFNTFLDAGAFARDPATGRYAVDATKMAEAVTALASRILVLQGDGDHAGVGKLFAELGVVRPALAGDIAALGSKGIPVDIVLEQGLGVLGLE
jgi:hypothetical protein